MGCTMAGSALIGLNTPDSASSRKLEPHVKISADCPKRSISPMFKHATAQPTTSSTPTIGTSVQPTSPSPNWKNANAQNEIDTSASTVFIPAYSTRPAAYSASVSGVVI